MLDVVDLRAFYASPVGGLAQRMILAAIRKHWENLRDYAVLGLGYAPPYLDALKADSPERMLAFMPAQQGVVAWPGAGLAAASLVEPSDLPLRDQSIDRILCIHALETAARPDELMDELWRILSPGGRLLAIVPNRRGIWARADNNPFAQGQPFSRRQVTALMRNALFTPIEWSEALYFPPMKRKVILKMAAATEAIGARLSLPLAGVHIIEATKQVYRPVLARKAARIPAVLRPILAGSNRDKHSVNL
jgi:SAM-dependent methyltransferase